MLMTRIITAIVLLILFAGAIYLGPNAINLVLAIAMGLVLAEWLKMTKLSESTSYALGLMMTSLGVALIFANVFPTHGFVEVFISLVAAIWMAITGIVFVTRHRGFGVGTVTSRILAFSFVSAAWLSMYWLVLKGGWQLMLSVFALVWAADIFAYTFGRLFGRHRMATALSPKKSWEGAAGAFFTVMLLAVLAWQYLPHHYVFSSLFIERVGLFFGLMLVVLLVAISIVGDLFESALKRQAGIKDSGRLLPGHGGFYDRLDAAVAVFPCTVAMFIII